MEQVKFEASLSTQQSAFSSQHSAVSTQHSVHSSQQSAVRTQYSGLRTQYSEFRTHCSLGRRLGDKIQFVDIVTRYRQHSVDRLKRESVFRRNNAIAPHR